MKDMLALSDYSKQALFKYRRRVNVVDGLKQEVLVSMSDIRTRHKRMGCRAMYYATSDPPVGRDRFEQIGFANGFKLKRRTNVVKTTWGQRVEVYPNLIEGMTVNGINQVWQSDIFYCKVENKDCYGVTIIDVYSRRLLALHMSYSMRAEHLVKALQQAIKSRKGMDISGCIFHSDRGSQYISKSVKQLITWSAMKMSMCKMPQQNAYVERIQGTLKNDYLNEHILTTGNLQSVVSRIKSYYNNERPHSSLKMMCPARFETYVNTIVHSHRPETHIYQWIEEK